ncbi:hypothetical protein FOL47_009893 [Perkinsus chesapeaki]|uniref:Uncharacterized protein n=1 Tax=Perkinsus chesapeaki TaxID=330153 RepID=A0A7J6MQY1_PERCH|nr:hypothetical protein FOL47_009893 [Perkinsus chesapeaki]
MLKRNGTSSSSSSTMTLSTVPLPAVHMFLTALTDEGFFRSTKENTFLEWKASDECRGKLVILARPEKDNYQKMRSVQLCARDCEGPIEREAMENILVYLSSELTISNCVDHAARARRDPKIGGYLGVRTGATISRRVKVQRKERRLFPTLRTSEIDDWRDGIEKDILAASADFGEVAPIYCPLCCSLLDNVRVFAGHVVGDDHRKRLQRTLNERPSGRILTAEIRLTDGGQPLVARVDLIGNNVIPEKNVPALKRENLNAGWERVEKPVGVSGAEISRKVGMPEEGRRSQFNAPVVEVQEEDDDDDDVSIMSLD